MTSDLDFTEWAETFPANRLLVSATLDQMRHNAYCLVLNGQSGRTPKLRLNAPATPKSNRLANPAKPGHS